QLVRHDHAEYRAAREHVLLQGRDERLAPGAARLALPERRARRMAVHERRLQYVARLLQPVVHRVFRRPRADRGREVEFRLGTQIVRRPLLELPREVVELRDQVSLFAVPRPALRAELLASPVLAGLAPFRQDGRAFLMLRAPYACDLLTQLHVLLSQCPAQIADLVLAFGPGFLLRSGFRVALALGVDGLFPFLGVLARLLAIDPVERPLARDTLIPGVHISSFLINSSDVR